MARPHKMVPSTLGHGETMCVYCKGTNRELAVLGEEDNCIAAPRTCRVCGCTDNNCQQCIEKTGVACHWVGPDLCSACVEGFGQ